MSATVTGSCPARPIAAFRGRTTCRRGPNAVTLAGTAADADDESLIVTFVTSRAGDIPDFLTAPEVTAIDEQRFRITSASGAWELEAGWPHVHRGVGTALYRAIRPRPAPLRKRLFWRAVLALAGSTAGKRLLRALRRD